MQLTRAGDGVETGNVGAGDGVGVLRAIDVELIASVGNSDTAVYTGVFQP